MMKIFIGFLIVLLTFWIIVFFFNVFNLFKFIFLWKNKKIVEIEDCRKLIPGRGMGSVENELRDVVELI